MADDTARLAPPRPASFLGSVNVVMATYAVDGLLALATSALIAQQLGPEGRGAYGLFVLSAALGAMMLGLGIGNATIYYLNKGELSVRDALRAAHTITLVAAAVSAVAVAAIAPWAGGAVFGDDVSPWLLIAAVPAILYLQLLRLLLQGLSRFVDLGVTTVGQQVVLLALVSLAILTGDPSATTFVVLLIAASVGAALYALVRVGLRHVDLRGIPAPMTVMRPLARFGVQGEVGNVLQLLNYRMDQYLVRAFVSLAGVGIYAVAASLTEGVFIIANAVALVLMPRLTSADRDEAGWIAPVAARNTVLVAAGVSLALAAAAPLLIPLLFGEAFDESVEALWILLPGTVALAGSKVLTSYIFSQGQPLVNTAITVVGLAVTVVADLALIPWLGINGAALASSLAYGTHFAAALFAYSRISGQPALDAVLPRPRDAQLYADAVRGLRDRVTGRPQLAGR